MSKISLQKRQEVLKISLKKANVSDKLTLRVACALDISGSMQNLYRNGSVSELVGKLLPFGMMFDDNAQIDMWAFNHGSSELPPATESVYDDYVNNCMKNVPISGGTNYAPVMGDIYDEYFGGGIVTKTVYKEVEVDEYVPAKGFMAKLTGKKELVKVKKQVSEEVVDHEAMANVDTTPAMVFFQTDGSNSDESAVISLLNRNKDKPIYWFMVGVGDPRYFGFIKRISDEFDNVDFISVKDLDLSDEELYNKLLSGEFGQWIKTVGVKGA